MAVFQNKFKAGFVPARDRSLRGSAKDVQQGKKRKSERSSVMIAFSGGQSSRCAFNSSRIDLSSSHLVPRTLLDLVVSFFPTPDPAARYTAPPPFATLEVVYVDESGLPGYGVSRASLLSLHSANDAVAGHRSDRRSASDCRKCRTEIRCAQDRGRLCQFISNTFDVPRNGQHFSWFVYVPTELGARKTDFFVKISSLSLSTPPETPQQPPSPD